MTQASLLKPSSSISPEQAARELLRRDLAQESLIAFTRYTKPDYKPAGHHKTIADALERVERGECKRLMIFMPPRHGKSELASRRFPAWFLGRNPDRSIIAASYNSELATDFGREVRDIVATKLYSNVFGTRLSDNSQAAGRWHTNGRGGYVAAGVGTAVTGRGAHVLLIDDPFKDRQDADSDIIRERVWRWYTSTAYTRLEGDITATALEDDDIWADFLQEIEKGDAEPFEGAVVLIQCMTGDTPVLMADGSEKALRDVRRGDAVATYENGRISTAKVLNWALQGSDQTYEIRTISGTTVRANERHPFLVERDGKLEWIRLRDLKIGDAMLRAKGRGSARLAPTKDATAGQKPRATATITTRRSNGPADTAHHRLLTLSGVETSSYGIDTELGPLNTTRCSPNKVAFVPFVSGKRQKDHLNIGAKHSALTIVTILERSEDCSATTATLSLGEDATSPSLSELSAIYSIDRDCIQSILPSGREDVFDIQVERTENFIANGLVSHNTRWNEDDLGGRLLRAEAEGGDKWEALDLPAIDDAGQALWPEKFSVERLHRIRAAIGPRDWSALYQQRPTPDEGTYFQRLWFHRHAYAEPKRAKATRHVYITSDFAVTDDGGDYTEHAVWGYGNNGTLAQLDWWHGQKDASVWIERLIDLIEKWAPLCYFGEQGVIEKAVRPMLVRRLRERKASCRIEWVPSVRDKATRARPFQARASMGKVSLLNDERGERVLGQLLTFPAGRYDDAVDVCSLIGLVIDQAHPAIVPPPKLEKSRDGWGAKADDYETSDADWKSV